MSEINIETRELKGCKMLSVSRVILKESPNRIRNRFCDIDRKLIIIMAKDGNLYVTSHDKCHKLQKCGYGLYDGRYLFCDNGYIYNLPGYTYLNDRKILVKGEDHCLYIPNPMKGIEYVVEVPDNVNMRDYIWRVDLDHIEIVPRIDMFRPYSFTLKLPQPIETDVEESNNYQHLRSTLCFNYCEYAGNVFFESANRYYILSSTTAKKIDDLLKTMKDTKSFDKFNKCWSEISALLQTDDNEISLVI